MADVCDMSDLCAELRGASDTEFSRAYGGDPPNRILMSHGSLRVLADLSPLTEGHLLIAPVDHFLNFAQFAASHPGEVAALTSRLAPVVRQVYGNIAYLEHGSSSDMRRSACINHAHLHALPIDADDVADVMRADGMEEVRLEHFEALSERARDDLPYYLVSDTHRVLIFGIGEHMPKQYLRAVAARVLRLEDGTYDWAGYIRHNVCRRTIATFRDVLAR